MEEAAPATFYLPATAQPLEDSDEVLVSIGTRKSTTGPLQQQAPALLSEAGAQELAAGRSARLGGLACSLVFKPCVALRRLMR